eukprot:scaffold888_cov569-Prasinococcus_capsulatus_cf.AAC.20
MIAQLDDVNYALDGLGASSDLRVLRSNALSLAELCSVKSQRCLFASQVSLLPVQRYPGMYAC